MNIKKQDYVFRQHRSTIAISCNENTCANILKTKTKCRTKNMFHMNNCKNDAFVMRILVQKRIFDPGPSGPQDFIGFSIVAPVQCIFLMLSSASLHVRSFDGRPFSHNLDRPTPRVRWIDPATGRSGVCVCVCV